MSESEKRERIRDNDTATERQSTAEAWSNLRGYRGKEGICLPLPCEGRRQ